MLPSLVSQCKIDSLINFAKTVENVPGDYWELGVYQGGTASRLINCIPSNKKLVLFDSFEGLPEVCSFDNHHKKGDFFDANLDIILDYFKKYPNVTIVKGWIPDTLKDYKESSICFAHIDLDLYEGYKSSLEFIWPRLSIGGIVVFDDYYASSCLGAKRAVDEFVKDNNIVLNTKNGHDHWIVKI